jgi:multidrug efflux pump subunit AcrB
MREVLAIAIFVGLSVTETIASDSLAAVRITVEWPAGSSEEVELQLATPMEAQLKQIPRLFQLRSTSVDGRLEVRAAFPAHVSCAEFSRISSIASEMHKTFPKGTSAPLVAMESGRCKDEG